MRLRAYRPEDCAELAKLFYNTVHTINAKDYTQTQLDVWATGEVDKAASNTSFLEHNTVVAEIDQIITGFGDMDDAGYLDRLYVHRDYQNMGVATSIVSKLERQAASRGISLFRTHASITAKPFFEKRGYHVLQENKIVRSGVELKNYVMEKDSSR